MIHREDETPLQKREELIIPITIIVTKEGKITKTAYPSVLPLLQKWDATYGADPLSAFALQELERILSPFLQAHGYEREEEDVGRIHLTFEHPEDAPLCAIDPSCIRLQGNEWFSYENTTDFYPDYTDQIAYVTLLDGKIMSVAAENPNGDDALAELYLETHPDVQGNGLATKNATALISELHRLGKRVLYRCADDHAASKQIATKLQFTEIDRFYCHNAYRIEES